MTSRLRNISTRLIFALAALVAGSLFLEGLARLIYDRNGMHYDIEMWKYARQLKRPSSNPAMGHEHQPGTSARLMGTDVSINSLGLRYRELRAEKPSKTYRILVLGDSMTFGWGVSADDTFCSLLEERLNRELAATTRLRYEVVNAGVGNYNTVQELAYLEERGFQLNPDRIILAYYINDAEPLCSHETSFLSRHSYLYVFMSSGWDFWARRSGSRPTYADYYRQLYRDDASGWQACRTALTRLATLCREKRIPLSAVLLVELHQVGPPYPFADIDDKVRNVLDSQQVPTLDLQDAFAGQSPSALWVSSSDAHPNAKAHRIINESLFKFLEHDLQQPTP